MYSSKIASVGQASIHLVQAPHKSLENGLLYSNSKSTNISAKKNHEPILSLIKLVCLPIQPSPDFCAHFFSKIGDVSTQTLYLNSLFLLF